MSMYKEVYYILFNEITEVIKIIESGNNMDREKLLEEACSKLKRAQLSAEERIIGGNEAI